MKQKKSKINRAEKTALKNHLKKLLNSNFKKEDYEIKLIVNKNHL